MHCSTLHSWGHQQQAPSNVLAWIQHLDEGVKVQKGIAQLVVVSNVDELLITTELGSDGTISPFPVGSPMQACRSFRRSFSKCFIGIACVHVMRCTSLVIVLTLSHGSSMHQLPPSTPIQ